MTELLAYPTIGFDDLVRIWPQLGAWSPAVREQVEDAEDLLDEANVEHQSAKELIAQIEAMKPNDELYDAKVKVLGEYVRHHVKEEQNELFPDVRKSELDLNALGEQLQARKMELMA